VQLTPRDEVMLDWLATVRFADANAIRWAMSGLAGRDDGKPVALRKAQRWMMRMASVGVIDRGVPAFQSAAVAWNTDPFYGRKPDIYRQTARHDAAVALVSAIFLSRGFVWKRDQRAEYLRDHQADGVATRGNEIVLVEVELTPKAVGRYGPICRRHALRLEDGEVSRVEYYCTPGAARTISREADRWMFRDVRPRLDVIPAFDARGKWVNDSRGSRSI
jgi:hypothetical protein